MKKFEDLLEDMKLWKILESELEPATLGQGDPNLFFGIATSTYQDP